MTDFSCFCVLHSTLFYFYSMKKILLSTLFNITFFIVSLRISHHTSRSCSLSSPSKSPHLVTPQKSKNKIRIIKRFNLYYPYTHWKMAKLLVACPLNRAEPFPSHTPTSGHHCGESHFSIPITLQKSSLWWIPVQAVFLGGGLGSGRQGCHRSISCRSILILVLQSSISQQINLLALHSQQQEGSEASRLSLVTAQIENMAPGCSGTTDPDKALRGSQTTDINMPQVAVQATLISVVPGRSTANRHQHVPRRQCRPQISTWSSLLAWAMDINTDRS